MKKPINNAPIQLTNNVPKVKFILKDELIKLFDKYLNNAPIPPPIIINKYSIKHTPKNIMYYRIYFVNIIKNNSLLYIFQSI